VSRARARAMPGSENDIAVVRDCERALTRASEWREPEMVGQEPREYARVPIESAWLDADSRHSPRSAWPTPFPLVLLQNVAAATGGRCTRDRRISFGAALLSRRTRRINDAAMSCVLMRDERISHSGWDHV